MTSGEIFGRTLRGSSLVEAWDDYTVIDLETTGLSPTYDEILEMAAVRVRAGEAVATYSQLVKPACRVSSLITSITGISNDMVKDAPAIADVIGDFADFIAQDRVVGHNVSFDVNFVYHNLGVLLDRPFSNDFVNTIRVARRVRPGLPSYRLGDLCREYGIEVVDAHRALGDCLMTHKLYSAVKAEARKLGIRI